MVPCGALQAGDEACLLSHGCEASQLTYQLASSWSSCKTLRHSDLSLSACHRDAPGTGRPQSLARRAAPAATAASPSTAAAAGAPLLWSGGRTGRPTRQAVHLHLVIPYATSSPGYTLDLFCSPLTPSPSGAFVFQSAEPPCTLHRWEAHIWVKELGRQVYLGGYEHEEHAAEAYDVAALKCKGPRVKTNFTISRCVQSWRTPRTPFRAERRRRGV